MKTLLAVTTIALTLAAGAVTARAQGPGSRGPGPGPGFAQPIRPGFIFDGPGDLRFRRGPAPYPPRGSFGIGPGFRRVPPPLPGCYRPPVRFAPPLVNTLRFIFRR